MENSISLCLPDAYPISIAIVEVSVLTLSRGLIVSCGELPATRITAIVSPTAREIPRITPAITPELACGSTTFQAVCILLAPSERLASLTDIGTARRDVSAIVITVGRIISARTIMADNSVFPEGISKVVRTNGTITIRPKKP
jgi:hypothetical protein